MASMDLELGVTTSVALFVLPAIKGRAVLLQRFSVEYINLVLACTSPETTIDFRVW